MPHSVLLSPVVPLANGVGIEKRASAHLNALRRIGEVDLVLLLTEQQIAHTDIPRELSARCRRVDIVQVASASNMRLFRMPGVTTLLRLATYGRHRRVIRDHTAAQRLSHMLRCGDHSLVLCYRLSSFALLEYMPALPLASAKRLVVDFDDIESNVITRLLRQRDSPRGIEQTLLLKLERAETLRIEQLALAKASLVTVCSNIDACAIKMRKPQADVRVQPNSFPARDALTQRHDARPLRILFLGTMTYHPNEDAALYFCKKILPMVQRELEGEVQIEIVGKSPSPQVRALAEEGLVHVTGGVPDVEPHYAAADVVVVPIRYGGGTRIKILEALALGKPVISTTTGAEGLDLRNGEDILLADTPDDFAQHCISLAHDPARRARLAESGRARFMKLYEATSVESAFADELRRVCGEGLLYI